MPCDESARPRGVVFGVPLDLVTMDQAVEACVALVERGRFASQSSMNVGKVVLLRDEPSLRVALDSADLVCADGQGVVWGARLLGVRVPERVAGIDLMERLLAACQERGWPVYFLGATEDVLTRFIGVVRARFPELAIAGVRNGYFDDDPAVAERVAESGARVLFIGMSSPRKECFTNEQRGALGTVLAVGVGGSFDVWAGKTRRAPGWMQRVGLEWFYRFAQEPRRMWRRYLVGNVRFAAILLREIVAGDRERQ